MDYLPIRPGADAGVIRSQQEILEKYLGTGTVPEIGVPGTTSNIPGYKGLAEGNAEYNRSETTTNYEITEHRTEQEKNQGDIARLSVAVILNEGIKNQEGDPYAKATLVREVRENLYSAANLDANRGDAVDVKVYNFKMDKTISLASRQKDQEKWRRIFNMMYLGLALLAILAVIFLSWYFLRNAVVAEEIPEEEVIEGIEEAIPVEELKIPELTEEQRTREKILEEVLRMIQNDPEGASLIIRSWMFEEPKQ